LLRPNPRLTLRESLLLLVVVALAVVLIAKLNAGDIPTSPNQAHAYADGVLAPRFHAAVNEFEYRHPRDKTPGAWDHVQQLDKPDTERWREVVKAFEQYRRAMKTAGYE
jgi:hypothetical protein